VQNLCKQLLQQAEEINEQLISSNCSSESFFHTHYFGFQWNDIQNRYRELMTMSRQWNDLALRKRFGFGHHLDSKPSHGDLALFCPACPQPGVNIPSDTSNDPQ
jgi:hypothetical protein